MIRFALLAAPLLASAAVPAGAQTAQGAGGGSGPANVGSVLLGNRFPAGGGSSVGAGGIGGNVATGGASGTPTGAGRGGGGGGFVLYPPSGASGEAAFLLGTDLSCAPQ